VAEVFGPGTRLQDAIRFVRERTGTAEPADLA
jgi:hypothetical protein